MLCTFCSISINRLPKKYPTQIYGEQKQYEELDVIQKLDRITRIDYNGIWNRVFSYIFTSICFELYFSAKPSM